MTEDFANDSTSISQRIALIVEHFAAGNNSLAAKTLGVSEGTIRSYKNGTTPKADVLEKIVTIYEVNAMWLLTGVGDMLAPNASPLHNLGLTSDSSLVEFFKQFDPMLQQRDAKLLRQAEELGQLREQLAQARREIEQLRSEKNENIIAQAHTQTAPAVAP